MKTKWINLSAFILAIIVFPILLVNCGKDEMGQGRPDNARIPGHVSLPDQAMGKEALRSLVEADRLWSKAASEGDFEGFVSFLDEKVVWFFCNPDFPPILNGKEAVAGLFGYWWELFPEFGFSWEPKLIEVSNSGDMGYAYGTYTTSFDPLTEHNYSTVWRRKGGGDWKVVLETDF